MIKSIWDVPFIVVDVETTGSSGEKNRITDIACITVIGGEIISEYSSMVNPHQFIPPFIQEMTGITNEKAALAPEPDVIFTKIYDILSIPNAIFVAHNASFDWNFVMHSLIRTGYVPPEIPRLCTIKLARRLLSSNIKKNVGNLANYLSINVKNRHRALGDAKATAQILIELLERAEYEHDIRLVKDLLNFQNKPIKNFRQPSSIIEKLKEYLDNLPNEPGTYYFYSKSNAVLYVGKAKSLRDRVRSYFTQPSLSSDKLNKLVKLVEYIKWECTGTELAALLLESKEIKRISPPYNTMEKRYKFFPFIKLTTNELFPHLEMCYSIEQDNAEYYGPFHSATLVQEIIQTLGKSFKLRKCEKSISSNPNTKPCFYYHIERCGSPCSANIDDIGYMAEVDKVRYFLSGFSEGIIEENENAMYELADNLEFEKAEIIKHRISHLKKIFGRAENVPTSVNDNNLILILPASLREKTVELFFIRAGKLIHQEIIGRKSPMKQIKKYISEIFFNGKSTSLIYSIEDIDELRIISSWLFRKQNAGTFVYINGRNEDNIAKEVEIAIRNIQYETEEDSSEIIE